MIYHHGHILLLSKNAYERSLEESSESFVAIMLSAMALECYINDFSEMIRSTPGCDTKIYQDLAYILETLEKSKDSLITKIEAIHYILTGKDFEKGDNDHQELSMLIRLRNELVHRKPESTKGWGASSEKEFEPHNIVKFFSDRKIIERPSSEAPPVWSQYTNRPEVARWAINNVINIIQNIVSILPESTFKDIQKQINENRNKI